MPDYVNDDVEYKPPKRITDRIQPENTIMKNSKAVLLAFCEANPQWSSNAVMQKCEERA